MDALDLVLASEDFECVTGVAHDIRYAHVASYFTANGALAYLPGQPQSDLTPHWEHTWKGTGVLDYKVSAVDRSG